MELSVPARGGLCVCEEGACVPTNECGVFMRERRGGCPGDCRRGFFVESGDLLGSERGASSSLPRSTRTAGLIFALQQFPSPSVVVRARGSSGARSCVLGGGFRVSGARSWLGRAVGRAREAAEQERACCPLRPVRGAAG